MALTLSNNEIPPKPYGKKGRNIGPSNQMVSKMVLKMNNGTRLMCSILEPTYQLISMSKECLRDFALYDVFNLIFFRSDDEDLFFSFIETEEEISIVMDNKIEFRMDSDHSTVSNQHAIVLHVDPISASGAESVNEFVKPLLEDDIDLVLFNTCNASVILVPEESMEFVVETIRNSFCIVDENFISTYRSLSIDSLSTVTDITEFRPSNGDEDMIRLSCDKSHSTLDLTSLPGNLALCTLKREDIPQCAYAILRSFFYHHDENLASLNTFTIVNGIVTLVLVPQFLQYFPQDLIRAHENSWKALQVSKGEVMVSQSSLIMDISSTLTNARVPFSYIGTISSDYIMLECKNIESSVQHLKEQLPISIHFDGR